MIRDRSKYSAIANIRYASNILVSKKIDSSRRRKNINRTVCYKKFLAFELKFSDK